MPRHQQEGSLDDQLVLDADLGFMGVNERLDPEVLPAGTVARAINKRFDGARAATRHGFETAGFGTNLTKAFDWDFVGVDGVTGACPGGGASAAYPDILDGEYTFWYDLSAVGTNTLTDLAVGDWVTVAGSNPFTDYDGDWEVVKVTNDPATGLTSKFWVSVTETQWFAAGGLANLMSVDPILFIQFDEPIGFGKIYGVGKFSDPSRTEGLLLATEYYCLFLVDGSEPQRIYYPEDVTITSDVWFVQAFDRVLMLRGSALAPMVWNPQQAFEGGLGVFALVDDNDLSGTYLDSIPNSSEGIVFANRLFLVQGRDQIVYSEILEYTQYDSSLSQFRINAGTDDSIVRIVPFNQTTLIIFKDQSVELLGNVINGTGTIGLESAFADTLTREMGLVARGAVTAVGSDIWFLSEGGVYSIKQALDNKLQATAVPISDPIQPVIERINWDAASGSLMSYWGNRVYVAVPLDNADYNNALLVYDTQQQAWSGYWTSPNMLDVIALERTDYNGRRSIVAVNGDSIGTNRANGAVYVLETGNSDWLYDTDYDISDEVLTRAYSAKLMDRKGWCRLMAEVATWNPSFSLSLRFPGPGEDQTLLSAVTKDRTKYAVWGHAPYVESNINDDHGEPYREDYSVELETGETLYLGSNGIDFDAMQVFDQSIRLRRRGKSVQVKLVNTQGKCELRSIQIEGVAHGRDLNIKT